MCYLCLQKKYSPGQTDIEQNWAAPEVTLVQELFFSISEIASTFNLAPPDVETEALLMLLLYTDTLVTKNECVLVFPLTSTYIIVLTK